MTHPITAAPDIWKRNEIQFPRLIAEIVATQELDLPTLADSMDLSLDSIQELLDRADQVWEAAKGNSVRQQQPVSHEQDLANALRRLMKAYSAAVGANTAASRPAYRGARTLLDRTLPPQLTAKEAKELARIDRLALRRKATRPQLLKGMALKRKQAAHVAATQPPVADKGYEEGEVIGLETDGTVIQWNALDQEGYTSGETLAEYGIHNLRPHELACVGVSVEQHRAAAAEYNKAQIRETLVAERRGEISAEQAVETLATFISQASFDEFVVDAFARNWITPSNLGFDPNGNLTDLEPDPNPHGSR